MPSTSPHAHTLLYTKCIIAGLSLLICITVILVTIFPLLFVIFSLLSDVTNPQSTTSQYSGCNSGENSETTRSEDDDNAESPQNMSADDGGTVRTNTLIDVDNTVAAPAHSIPLPTAPSGVPLAGTIPGEVLPAVGHKDFLQECLGILDSAIRLLDDPRTSSNDETEGFLKYTAAILWQLWDGLVAPMSSSNEHKTPQKQVFTSAKILDGPEKLLQVINDILSRLQDLGFLSKGQADYPLGTRTQQASNELVEILKRLYAALVKVKASNSEAEDRAKGSNGRDVSTSQRNGMHNKPIPFAQD